MAEICSAMIALSRSHILPMSRKAIPVELGESF
jgi:hypothetical protein